LIRPAVVIPENKPVAKLMREMQRDHFHMAIVADEYGSITGLVTLEEVFGGLWPFLWACALMLGLLVAFPEIVMYLPEKMR
jgi:TRAP-type mannitol/chloroaromatic compound transport system permease large subunit